MLIFVWGLGKS